MESGQRAFLEDLIIAATALGLQLISVPIRTSDDFDGAFAAMMQRQPNAFVTTNDDLMLQHIEQIIDFAARHRSALQSRPTLVQLRRNITGVTTDAVWLAGSRNIEQSVPQSAI